MAEQILLCTNKLSAHFLLIISITVSIWMPPKGGDAAIETFIRQFRADVKQQLEVNQPKRCLLKGLPFAHSDNVQM